MNARLKPLVERMGFIGGSDVPAILGLSKWASPFDIWLVKTGRPPRVAITPEQQKRFDRGHRLEPIVLSMLVERLRDEGHEVRVLRRNKRYVDKQYPFMRAEIDFELRLDGEHVNGDCKTVHPFAFKNWGDEFSDEVPVMYAAQFMHGLGVTGRKRCLCATLLGLDDLLIYWIERDEVTIEAMRARVAQFWHECVIADVEPDPIDFDDCYAIYEHSNGGRIEATSEVRDAVYALAEVRRKLKALGHQEEELKFLIADYMRPNAFLGMGKLDIATWKEQSDSRIDVHALREEEPEIAERFTRVGSKRVLRLKV